ncbi:MAG: DUF2157 domain-containing protein [Rhodobiaceae bacterium]|nr:DUF2157 domain-containing protein [Rhodobiaceae bacterium]MCC0055954.1 DUF2157 domain-containing protein [Rhodobiaceae bacterium]
MLGSLYRNRLRRDLENWRDEGVIDAATVRRIEEQLSERQSGSNLAQWLAGLGVVLVAAAAIAFVAANWEAVPRLMRCGLLVAGMIVCYAGAGWLFRAGHPKFADLAVALGAALFGASIVLVAQSYHIEGDAAGAFLIWGLGAFIASILGNSRASLVLAFAILTYWAFVWFDDGARLMPLELPWHYLPVIAGTVLVAWWLDFARGITLAVAAIFGWTMVTLLLRAEDMGWLGYPGILAVLAAPAALGSLGALARTSSHETLQAIGFTTPPFALLGSLGSLFILQFAVGDDFGTQGGSSAEPLVLSGIFSIIAVAAMFLASLRGEVPRWAPVAIAAVLIALHLIAIPMTGTPDDKTRFFLTIALAGLILVAAIAMILYGQATMRRQASMLGGLMFVAEVLYIYQEAFGSLLDSASFFMIGGLILIGLAVWLVRRQRRIGPVEPAETGAQA